MGAGVTSTSLRCPSQLSGSCWVHVRCQQRMSDEKSSTKDASLLTFLNSTGVRLGTALRCGRQAYGGFLVRSSQALMDEQL